MPYNKEAASLQHETDLANEIKAMRLADLDYKIKEAQRELDLLKDVRSRWKNATPAHILEQDALFESESAEREASRQQEELLRQDAEERYADQLRRQGRNKALKRLSIGSIPAAIAVAFIPGITIEGVGVGIYLWCIALVLSSSL